MIRNSRNYIIVKACFHQIWIVSEISSVKWAYGHNLYTNTSRKKINGWHPTKLSQMSSPQRVQKFIWKCGVPYKKKNKYRQDLGSWL